MNKEFDNNTMKEKLTTLRYEVWGKLITKIFFLNLILEIILVILAHIISSFLDQPYKEVVRFSICTLPNIIITLHTVVVSYMFQNADKKDRSIRFEIYRQLYEERKNSLNSIDED